MKGKSRGQECGIMPRAILSSLGPRGLSIPQGPGGVGCGSSAGRTRGAGRGDLLQQLDRNPVFQPWMAHPKQMGHKAGWKHPSFYEYLLNSLNFISRSSKTKIFTV